MEEFVRHLYEIAKQCNFGLNKEEFLRDRMVIGMADKELSERLQLWAEGSLQDAIHAARQSEVVKMQMTSQPRGIPNLQKVRTSRGQNQGAQKKSGNLWPRKGEKKHQQGIQKQ